MNPSPGNQVFRPERVIALVDGFNLHHGLLSRFGNRMLWLDLEQLIESLLKPGQQLLRVVYFTARVRNDPVAVANQHTYLNALAAACPRVTVQFGRFQEKRWACRVCGATWRSYEEKETDVGIAVALVEAAATKSYDVALLVSADSDLGPAVHAARRLNPAGRLIAVFPPNRQSPVLARQVDASFRLGDARIRAAQFPEAVSGGEGRHLRPLSWNRQARTVDCRTQCAACRCATKTVLVSSPDAVIARTKRPIGTAQTKFARCRPWSVLNVSRSEGSEPRPAGGRRS